MATSGTNTFNLDVDQVIEEAFERCGINSRSGYDLKSARRSLNIMLAEWANRGINPVSYTHLTLPTILRV